MKNKKAARNMKSNVADDESSEASRDSTPAGSGSGKKRRGNLPKDSVCTMKDWLHQHRYNPYPTEEEKRHLAEHSKLTETQVCNWFINARRRVLPGIIISEGRNPENFTISRHKNKAATRTRAKRHKSSSPTRASLPTEAVVENLAAAISRRPSSFENPPAEPAADKICSGPDTPPYTPCDTVSGYAGQFSMATTTSAAPSPYAYYQGMGDYSHYGNYFYTAPEPLRQTSTFHHHHHQHPHSQQQQQQHLHLPAPTLAAAPVVSSSPLSNTSLAGHSNGYMPETTETDFFPGYVQRQTATRYPPPTATITSPPSQEEDSPPPTPPQQSDLFGSFRILVEVATMKLAAAEGEEERQ